MAMCCTNLAIAVLLAFLCRRENTKRRNGERDYVLEGKTQEEIERLGSRHPRFILQWCAPNPVLSPARIVAQISPRHHTSSLFSLTGSVR